jgi:hypothetical protein
MLSAILTGKLMTKGSAAIRRRAQSAMEFLTTYGWAILLIALALTGIAYYASINFWLLGPRALPGSCLVSRPDGPGSLNNINFQGVCNGDIPSLVPVFTGKNYIETTPYLFNLNNAQITIEAWFNMYGGGGTVKKSTGAEYLISTPIPGNGVFIWIDTNGYVHFGFDQNGEATSGNAITPGKWYQVVVTYDGSNLYMYLNGRQEAYSEVNRNLPPMNSLYIGTFGKVGSGSMQGYFNGSISNVQLYNASLGYNAVQQSYREGIGGTPVDLQHLVVWYPLNGNLNDYSGNGNNATSGSFYYTSSWTGGYAVP